MADSPLKDVALTTYEILIEGNTVSQTVPVTGIYVNRSLNHIPYATVRIGDGSPAKQDFPLSEGDDFVPGKEIEIKAGYLSKNESIFKGVIVRQSLIVNRDEAPLIEVECKEKVAKMTVVRKSAFFEKQKDSDIISSIIGDAGLSADVEETNTKHESLTQYNCTDWDFILMRSEANGKVVSCLDGKVSVKAPEVSSSEVLTVTFGKDLVDMKMDLDAQNQLSEVKSMGWDPSEQKAVTATGKNPSVNAQGNIDSKKLAEVFGISDTVLRNNADATEKSLEDWASAKMLKSWMSRVRGEVRFQGNTNALPGKTLEMEGVGDRFNGKAYVSGVEHEIEDGHWVTTCYLGLEPSWFATKPDVQPIDVSGLMAGVKGLLTGVVKQLDEDPEDGFRVMVNIPVLFQDGENVWARMSNFYSTSGQGVFFIPEIGDEVILGFVNGDPSAPIVLGSLYSGKNKAPYDMTKDNYTKAFTTKAENKIEFNDEKKIITITTPAENKVVLDDDQGSILIQDKNSNKMTMDDSGICLQDKNGNKITMSSGGIEIKSASDVKINATQNIQASATMDAEVKATNNVKISGLQITNTANAKFSASGNAQAELVSSGQTAVKGTMVMIN
ncbi:type IV secretion protein Rhs [Fulvitalea axinellae]|uniref:Type IV secretion protein Rhs n=1 Tax=Fulvitalea axinellae TaxID=1182444 RepID=A0AAU9D4L6_9BACT|nr:type IV secretion protein Rhs [Fulvitalea axinellae]